MKSFSIIFCVIFFFDFSSQETGLSTEIHKCCPQNQRLSFEINKIADVSVKDVCVTDERNKMFGFNIISSDSFTFPPCNNISTMAIELNGGSFETNGCIEFMGDQLSSLFCPSAPKIIVTLINKCCVEGQSYDFVERKCVSDAFNLGRFRDTFDRKVIIFQTNVPQCDEDEAFVEYHSTVHDIRFNRNRLSISTETEQNVFLSTNKFCIEAIVNHNYDKDKHVIVRSCRPRSVCDKIPCIRRCCENDQIMYRNKTAMRPACKNHPENQNFLPIFHDIEAFFAGDKREPEQIKVHGKFKFHCRF